MKPNIEYKQIEPNIDLLKRCIKLYYVHFSDDPNNYQKIIYYPNYVTTLNIYRNSSLEWNEFSRSHSFSQKDGYQILLVSKFDKSREIVMKGRFDKLTIVFNPLGINAFLKEPLSRFVANHFSFFDCFGNPFVELMDSVFAEKNLEKKRDFLDSFFIENYNEFNEPKIVYAVDKLMKSNGKASIEQLAKELNISRKTLLRLFKLHLDYSPREYKTIVKFRKALEAYQQQKQKNNFAALSYEADYYDQADLNKHFKKKTGMTPTELFSSLKTIEKGLYWKFDRVPKIQDRK